jgi:SAM-dependent methyltransferase
LAQIGLDRRHSIERTFHDAWASEIDLAEIHPRRSFESETSVENRRVLDWMGDPAGLRILDLGCGLGDAAVYFALRGAAVDAVDISPGMVEVCGRLAGREGVGGLVQAQVAVGEGLPFGDGTFDVVFGNGVLHHLDLGHAADEIARVLKPGGQGLFIEPLAYNPVIEVYRWLASGVRTKAEAALTYRQFRALGGGFAAVEWEETQLLTLLIFLWFFFVEWAHPSRVRYWKKIVNEGDRYAGAFRILNRMERGLLKALPFLKPLCWNVVIRVRKAPATPAQGPRP